MTEIHQGRTHQNGRVLTDPCERCGQHGAWMKTCISHRGDTEAYHGYAPNRLCRGCHIDLLPDPEILYTELLDAEFTFFYGCASGSSRKALRKMEESHVMVSYATENNGRLGTEQTHFADSGGAPDSFTDGRLADTGDYVTNDAEYLDYVEAIEADVWSLRDYPCEAAVLTAHERTVADHQRRTTERHRSLLSLAEKRDIAGQPVSILQGQSVDDYLRHLDALRDAGVLTDYVGIGSVCRRHATDEIQSIILAIRDALPARHRLHAFGVKLPVLEQQGVVAALSSADSCAYDFGLMMEAIYGDARYTWKSIVPEYLSFKQSIGELLKQYGDHEQLTIDAFAKEEVPTHARL
jgi:hypothetical protein